MATDMVDPQPTLVELLVRHVLLSREFLPQIEINSLVHWSGQDLCLSHPSIIIGRHNPPLSRPCHVGRTTTEGVHPSLAAAMRDRILPLGHIRSTHQKGEK